MAKTADFAAINLRGIDVILALHTAQDPIPAEWQIYVDLLEKTKKKNGGDISKARAIVVTDGGAPNAKQRELSNVAAGQSFKLVAISHSLSNPLKRGIVTAIAWVNPLFKGVMPQDWRDALRHVDLDGHIKPIIFEFERLQRGLPPVNSLALLLAETRSNVA